MNAEVKKRSKKTMKQPIGIADGFCVYLGPSIRGVIQSGTVYVGSKERVIVSLGTAIKQYPLIVELIVPNETLAEDRIKVKTTGNLLNLCYRKLLAGQKSF